MFISFLLMRLSEPSTYAGFGLIGTGIHNIFAGSLFTGMGQALTGLVAAVVPEGTQPPKKA